MRGGTKTRSLVGVVAAAAALWGVATAVDPGPAAGDSWPGTNGRIAYKSDPNNIWTIAPDGSTPLQLTTGTMENEEPHWSADGTKILFTRSGDPANPNQDIWSMNADGTNQVRLVTSTGTGFSENPSWSPDGTKIIFTRSVDGSTFHEELWTANADGSSMVQLTNDATHQSSEAVYSPDGTKIAFQVEPVILASADSTPSGPEQKDQSTTAGSTTVNGQLVTTCGTGGPFGGEIWVMNADGTGAVQVTNHPGCFDENPNWSPDGTKIAFTSNQSGHDEVWAIAPNGSGETQLTNTTFGSEHPAWSPDGTKITFASDRTGSDQIWAMNSDGSSPIQVSPVGSVNNGQPNWQPVIPPPAPPTPAATLIIAPRFTG